MPPTSAAAQADEHHRLAVHEVVLLLDTDPSNGLTEQVAHRRLERYGPNVLPAQNLLRVMPIGLRDSRQGGC